MQKGKSNGAVDLRLPQLEGMVASLTMSFSSMTLLMPTKTIKRTKVNSL